MMLQDKDACGDAGAPGQLDITDIGYVVLVESGAEVRRAIAGVLRGAGYRVLERATGHATCSLLGLVTPATLLLGLPLSDLSAEEMIKRLHARPQHARVPVVILAQGRDAYRLAIRLGADAGLPKPVNATALLEVMQVMTLWKPSRAGPEAAFAWRRGSRGFVRATPGGAARRPGAARASPRSAPGSR